MKQDISFENLPKHIYNPDIHNCNEKITMVINKRKISFEIDEKKQANLLH